MLDVVRIARDGGLLGLFLCAYVLLSLRINPRFILHDMPADVRAAAAPLSRRERWLEAVLAVPFLTVMLLGPLLSSLGLAREHPGPPGFVALAVNAYGVLFVASLADLVLLDLLLVCTLTPRWLVVPGTEGCPGYKDRRHQIRAHLRGALLIVPIALLQGALASVLR